MHGNSKLTPELQSAIVATLRLGLFIEEAAEYNGISAHTYHNWRRRGSQALEQSEKEGTDVPYDERPYAEFFLATREARIAGQAVHVGNLRNIALDERANDSARVRASTWLLERSWPDKWGRRDTVELTGKDGAEPLTIELKWPEEM